ncbi:MAG TPA: glycosyltransferase family 39 protein [Polyangiaceae bacterium]|nr:glycosyltransferase family 39 protein [Polyangiaceae bacterium]
MSSQAAVNKTEAWFLTAIIALALAVRVPQITASFYGDEGFSLLRDSNEWLTPTEDRFRPLFFSLLYFWRKLGFHGEFGLRSLCLLFGTLQIPVAFLLARRLAGVRAGLVFALLLALNPMLIEFSQELRMYSLVPLIALLQAWAFVEVVARTAEHRPVALPWVGFVLAGVAGVYTHFHYWFLMAGFGFAMLRRRRELSLKQGFAALLGMVAMYLPNVPNLMRFQREAGGAPHLLATDLPSALPKLLTAFSVGFNYFVLPDLGLDRAIRLSSLASNVSLALLVAIPSVLVVWQLVRLCATRNPGPAFWLSVELFAVPTLVSLVSVVISGRNFIHPKYMVFSAPFFPLLLTAGYLATPKAWLRTVLATTSALVLAIALVHFNRPEEYGRREDWRGAALLLRSTLDANSALLRLGNMSAPPEPAASPKCLWDYYAPDLFDRIKFVSLSRPDASVADVAPMVERLTEGKRDVYYLWSEISRNFEDPNDLVLTAARQSFVDEERRQFNPRFILYHWHRK